MKTINMINNGIARKLFTYTIAGGLCLTASTSFGLLNFTRNGTLWEGTYEGDLSDPTTSTPPFTVFDLSGGGGASDGSILTITSPLVGNRASWANSNFFGPGSLVRTVETRMKVDVQGAADGAAALGMSANGRLIALAFHTNEVWMTAGGSIIPGGTYALDTSVFHTYRVVIDQRTTTDQWRLYVDNALAISSGAALGASVPGFNSIFFGDTSGGGLAGTTEWDFLSWTAATAEVPEPTSVALLGIAGLVIWSKRRRSR